MVVDEAVTLEAPKPKYVIFKADEFAEIAPVITFPNEDVKQMFRRAMVEDGVVIRLQDTFASSALFGYANSISVAIDVLREAGLTEIAKGLQETADFFVGEAERSIGMTTKLPD